MITLSLDEYGDFEKVTGKEDAIFIGGILYDDKDVDSEKKNEIKRIKAYYGEVIKEASEALGRELVYPRALHVSGNNLCDVAKVKEIVGKTLGEFLKEGTYKGCAPQYVEGGQVKTLPERAGKYYVYTLLKSDVGKEDRLSGSVGMLRNDAYASNLYFHMASEVINRTVFQNPVLPDNSSFCLQIATRSSGNIARESDLAKQYKKLGYKGTRQIHRDGVVEELTLEDGTPAIYYELTNNDIYRTAVEQYLMERNDKSSSVKELKTVSISYNGDNLSQEFLYLADSVCSILSFKLNTGTENPAQSYVKQIDARGKNLIADEDWLLFGYDQVDVDYTHALDYVRQLDYYDALEVIYKSRKIDNNFRKLYSDKWFKKIEADIAANRDKYAFCRAVNALYDSQLKNNLDQEMCLYIANKLETMIPAMKEVLRRPDEQKIFYHFYEAAMISYDHRGNSAEAEAYYEKALPYAKYVSTEDFLRTRNILAGCFGDSCEPEKALELAIENAEYSSMVMGLKQHIGAQADDETSALEGKTYSQLAQRYAFMQDAKAEIHFKKALAIFEKDSPNYYITESYLLHYYIDQGMKDKYEQYAAEYFKGRNSLEEQLNYIVSFEGKYDPIINYRFALFLFSKALYTFYRDSISDSLWEKLKSLEIMREHPTEMIYKYLALIALDKEDEKGFKAFLKALKAAGTTRGDITYVILGLSISKVYEAEGDNEKAGKFRNEAVAVMEDSFRAFAGLGRMNREEQDRLIDSRITYMFR